MKTKLKSRRALALVAVIPALTPAVLLPLRASLGLPDAALGAALGFAIGLSAVALFALARGANRCP